MANPQKTSRPFPLSRKTGSIVEKDRQPPGRRQTTLQQIERAKYDDLTGRACLAHLFATNRVAQQVVADRFLGTAQRKNLADNAARRKLQADRPRIGAKHVSGGGLEIRDLPVPMPEHRGQRVGCAEHPLDTEFDGVHLGRSQIGRPAPLVGQARALLLPDDAGNQHGDDEEDDRLDAYRPTERRTLAMVGDLACQR